MKVYVLTMSANEENFKPEVFTSKEQALTQMKAYFDTNVEDFGDDVFSAEMNDESAEIIYTDDRYEAFAVFEVEVEGV